MPDGGPPDASWPIGSTDAWHRLDNKERHVVRLRTRIGPRGNRSRDRAAWLVPNDTTATGRIAARRDARNNRLTASGIARPSPDAARAPALSARNDWRAACAPQTERRGNGAPSLPSVIPIHRPQSPGPCPSRPQGGTIEGDLLGRTRMADAEQRTLFTTSEAAHLLGITPGAVKDAIGRGALDYIPINPRLNMVTLDAIEKYRRERLGKRGGYRGRKPKAAEDAANDAESSDTTS